MEFGGSSASLVTQLGGGKSTEFSGSSPEVGCGIVACQIPSGAGDVLEFLYSVEFVTSQSISFSSRASTQFRLSGRS